MARRLTDDRLRGLPSRQRVMIALKSFPSIKAAARSIGCKLDDLQRVAGVEAVQEAIARNKARKSDVIVSDLPEIPLPIETTEFEKERTGKIRRKMYMKYGNGNKHLAAAEFHRRLNTVTKVLKQAAADTSHSALSAAHAKPLAKPPAIISRTEQTGVGEYWCRFCKTDVAHDPCENCRRKTFLGASS